MMNAADFAEKFPETAAVVQAGIERRLHHGAQIYVSRRGEVLADVGLGIAAPDVPMTTETVLPWLSSGKPLTAILIARLQEAGRLNCDDKVAAHIPEFGNRGKEAITIRQLLTHTAGLHPVDPGWPEREWDESIQRLCTASLDPQWLIGESAAYDPMNSWFLLGEIVQRLTGRSFARVMADDLLKPLGMERTWAALSFDEHAARQAELGWMWERRFGKLEPLDWHESPRCTRPAPGASLRGPIRELGRFYEVVWHAITEERPPMPSAALSGEMIRVLTTRQRIGRFDQTFGHIVDFGLGFLIDSRQYGADTVPYGYGRFCSPRTFGHGGAQSSQGSCDPESGLVVAYVFNGRCGEGQHQRRVRDFHKAVYRDLAGSE